MTTIEAECLVCKEFFEVTIEHCLNEKIDICNDCKILKKGINQIRDGNIKPWKRTT